MCACVRATVATVAAQLCIVPREVAAQLGFYRFFSFLQLQCVQYLNTHYDSWQRCQQIEKRERERGQTYRIITV